MKTAILSLFAALAFTSAAAQDFVRGADISWYTEMQADGKQFYDANGVATSCPALMKAYGMDAVRLRVWADPAGGFSGTEDVVAKAQAATDAGLDVMIDFHYSDFFADPSRQDIPATWTDHSLAALKERVVAHTDGVLRELAARGIAPRWVQVGNETRNGMLWPAGQLWTDQGDIANGWQNYATLSNAAYEAVKAVCPDAKVIVHLNNAYEDLDWWFKKFRAVGGKFDMIGLSHYPQEAAYYESSISSWQSANVLAMQRARSLATTYGVPVIFSEIGVWQSDPETGKQVVADILKRAANMPECAGVFYWEPESYGSWRPSIYVELGWNAYNMGAFNNDGSPSAILDAFKEDSDIAGIGKTVRWNSSNSTTYHFSGQRATVLHRGQTYILDGRKFIAR